MTKCGTILCLLLAGVAASAQKIQYSRQTFPFPFAEAVHLIADVNGHHHLLCFNANKKPRLYIFDAALHSFASTELDVQVKETSDVRVLPLKNFYLLYLHAPGTTAHQFFRISGSGEAENVSDKFSLPADTAWNRSTATFQLFNQDGFLRLVSHTYFDAVKKIGSRVLTFDSGLAVTGRQTVFFPFDKDTESLQQVTLAGNDLLVLKTARDEEKGNSLEAVKVDLTTGRLFSNAFNCGSYLYGLPAMRFNASDASLYVYSLLHEPPNANRVQRSVFMAHLDSSLKEKVPTALLKTQFRNNAAANFLLLNAPQVDWLAISGGLRPKRPDRYAAPDAVEADAEAALHLNTRQGYYSKTSPRIEMNQLTGVRFTLLNNRFVPVKDSLVPNDGSFYNIQPAPYARFQLGGKAYLLLFENFSPKNKGLVLMSADGQGRLAADNVPVYDRYDYLLPQVQTLKDGSFLLPYTSKHEVGLARITPNE